MDDFTLLGKIVVALLALVVLCLVFWKLL